MAWASKHPHHDDKDVNKALHDVDNHPHIEAKLNPGKSSHGWGRIKCLICTGCRSVWSTPKVSGNHAKDIKRFIKRHAKCWDC